MFVFALRWGFAPRHPPTTSSGAGQYVKELVVENSLTSSSRPLSFLSNYHFLEGLPGCDFPADGCFQDFKERGSSPYTLPSEPF